MKNFEKLFFRQRSVAHVDLCCWSREDDICMGTNGTAKAIDAVVLHLYFSAAHSKTTMVPYWITELIFSSFR